jgi:hypothetical protein
MLNIPPLHVKTYKIIIMAEARKNEDFSISNAKVDRELSCIRCIAGALHGASQ